MRKILRLRHPIQHYPWGSYSAIGALQGRATPTPQREAELWMGVHPQGSSEAWLEGQWMPLQQLIESTPETVLGHPVIERFGPNLPFLFKVLAAELPLSIQTHPNARQAQDGFLREQKLGLDITAKERCYRDRNHKPELICALTPFWLLRGFRPWPQIQELLNRVGLSESLACAGMGRQQDVESFFKELMALPEERLPELLNPALAQARELEEEDPAFAWVGRLAQHFPGDRGILAPLLLNLMELSPGQAIFTGPGILHSYLQGVGVELMANSDNVLRGSLTRKHVDVSELLATLDFAPSTPEILPAPPDEPGEWIFETPAEEFSLAKLRVTAETSFASAKNHGVEILLCVEGAGMISGEHDPQAMAIQKGDSFLVSAAAGQYHLEGAAKLFRAQVRTCPG